MKKLILLLPLLFTFLFSKDITLQLSWKYQFQSAGYIVAKEMGIYEKYGLNVNLKEFDYDTNLSTVIETNKADFAVGRSTLLLDKAEGKDVVALAAIFQTSPLVFLSLKNKDIQRVSDLKYKKIMITSDARNTASLMAMMNSFGLQSDDFIAQKHSFDINDLISGKTDVMSSYLSNEPIVLDNMGIEYNVLKPKDYGFNFYSDILFTSSKYIQENPTLTKNFLKASLEGWKYAFENISEVSELIHSKYNTQNKTYKNIIKEGEVLKTMSFDESGVIGSISEKRLNEIVNVFKVLGIVRHEINIDSFIYEFNPDKKRLTINLSSFQIDIFLLAGIFFICTLILIFYFSSKIKKSNDLLNTVINSTDDYIFYKNSKLEYLDANDSFKKDFNKESKQLVSKTDYDLFPKSTATELRNNNIICLDTKKEHTHEQWLEIDDKKILLQIKEVPFKYSKNEDNGVVCVARDITYMHNINKKLKEQTYTDELTNALNRKSFNERLNYRLKSFDRYKETFSLAILDIDDFKYINDNFGHDVGDIALKELVSKINSNIREIDSFFRVGGEEFALIIPKTECKDAIFLCEKLRSIIESSKLIEEKTITVSFGVTQVIKGDNPDSIYKRADELLYKAKSDGKNIVKY